jgi:hypothetical protein
VSETFLVPVRTSKAGALALRTGRLLTGERVGLAFTSEASLLLAMGPSQQWARLGYQAMRAMLAPLGIKNVRIDPHRNLPKPGSSGRVGAEGAYVEPDTPVEKALADELAELLGLPQVSVDSQFFDELGMTSLMIAHFCTQVRERGDVPPVSAKDVYLHPTIRSLAATVDELSSDTWTPSQPEPREIWRASTAHRGQVDLGGPLEAPGNQGLDPVLPAFLAGERPDSGQSARIVRRLARLLAVPEGARGPARSCMRVALNRRVGHLTVREWAICVLITDPGSPRGYGWCS